MRSYVWITDVAPGDTEGFLSYAKALRTPTIYNAIKHAKRVDDVARYGFPESVRRHFERLDVFPRGLLPIADARAADQSIEEQLIDAMHKVFGVHPGFRANHAKGIVVEGSFKASAEEVADYAIC